MPLSHHTVLLPWTANGCCDIATTAAVDLGAPCHSPGAFTLASTLAGTRSGTVLFCYRVVSFLLPASIAALDHTRRRRHCHHCCCAPGCTLPFTWSFHLDFNHRRHSIGHGTPLPLWGFLLAAGFTCRLGSQTSATTLPPLLVWTLVHLALHLKLSP